MKSFAHQECIRRGLLSEDECPSCLLGRNYQTVLNFWHYLDKLDEDDFIRISTNYTKLGRPLVQVSSYVDEITPFQNSIWCRVLDSIQRRFNNVDYDHYSASWATHELIAMHKLIENKQPLIVVPLF